MNYDANQLAPAILAWYKNKTGEPEDTKLYSNHTFLLNRNHYIHTHAHMNMATRD